MRTNSPTLDTGIVIRRSLFLIVLIILTLGHLFVLFRGLDTPQAMDQAQIAREIARGNGFSTKTIRPVAYWQAVKAANGGVVQFKAFPDTYHSPLNPLINAAVLKLIGADNAEALKMGEKEMVFPLDRVIAAVSTLFFLMAIGVNYLLISRIFDPKIAGVTAVLMLSCELNWDFALSGLPQMLLLLLFSCGLFFAYRAVEAADEGRVSMTPAMLAGAFFVLMALTHWITIWIVLAYIIFAAVMFRPRGIIAASILALLLLAVAYPLIRANTVSNHPFGTAFLVLYNGLAGGSESTVMRTQDLDAYPLSLEGLILKVVRTTVTQGSEILPFLGGIIVAPLFFVSLLHPFKRNSIARFRWLILLMWVSGAFGMSLFGVSATELHPNQIHILFAPVMTAYGLAFVSILWSRLDFTAASPLLRDAHHFVIIAISAAPLLLALPQKVVTGLAFRDKGGVPEWPPYYAPALNLGMKQWVTNDQIVVSDQPWAVAWYADRMSLWLPTTKEGFSKLESQASDTGAPFAGILISPSSHNSERLAGVVNQYKEFTSLVLDGTIIRATYPTGLKVFENDPKLQDVAKRYPYRAPLVGMDMIYYSDQPIRGSESKNQ